MTDSCFLNAFKGTNERIPVWFMRQAGRYLPEYQKIRKTHSLIDMFESPKLAAEITCMPIKRIGVDAAILFADILTLPKAMGFDITFDNKKGPIVTENQFQDSRLIDDIPHVREAIASVKKMLPQNIPLIGFAGSPFTVATYLIEGGSSVNFYRTLNCMIDQPEKFHQLMDHLTENTITYLKMQVQAGIDVFQLFDTWAGSLREEEYRRFVLPYVKRIFDAVDGPSIYYIRNCRHLLNAMDETSAEFLSVCHTVKIGETPELLNSSKGIQGNLYNALLYADQDLLTASVEKILEGRVKHSKFIFNLNHGVMPDVDPEVLKHIVQQVHSYDIKK